MYPRESSNLGPHITVMMAAAALLPAALPGLAFGRSRVRAHHPLRQAPVLYVSPGGSDAQRCTHHAPCRTIGHAAHVATPGATIRVGRGTYREQVMVDKRLRLVGIGKPTIDAAGETNAIVITGPNSAHSTVQGFVAENADQEGILAMRTAHLTVRNNVVRHNDRGAAARPPVGECAPQGEVPGDCGEGLHLMSVAHSRVVGNRVTQNAGGILLTDELGAPTRISSSAIVSMTTPYDCGITAAGHNNQAVVAGHIRPGVAGIYQKQNHWQRE
jgi:hypothetical protein